MEGTAQIFSVPTVPNDSQKAQELDQDKKAVTSEKPPETTQRPAPFLMGATKEQLYFRPGPDCEQFPSEPE